MFFFPLQTAPSSGYMPIIAMSNNSQQQNQNHAMNEINALKMNIKTPIVAQTDQEGISGEFSKLLQLP